MDEFTEWLSFQRHLSDIGNIIEPYGFSWCSDDYPIIEIFDKKGINTLTKFKFESFEQVLKIVEELYDRRS